MLYGVVVRDEGRARSTRPRTPSASRRSSSTRSCRPRGPTRCSCSTFAALPRVAAQRCAPAARAAASRPTPARDLRRLARRLRPARRCAARFVDADGRRRRCDARPAVDLLDDPARPATSTRRCARSCRPPSTRRCAATPPLLRLAARAAGLGGQPRAARLQGPLDGDVSDALLRRDDVRGDAVPVGPRRAAVDRAPRRPGAPPARCRARRSRPFSTGVALAGGAVPLCLRWPDGLAGPRLPARCRRVPTLLLDGGDGPAHAARGRAGGRRADPAARSVVTVPHTGHSVLGSDVSGCANGAVVAFFAGDAGGRLRARSSRLADPPRRAARLAPSGRDAADPDARRGGARPSTTSRRQFVGDALRRRAERRRPARGCGGLRGGPRRVEPDALRLRRLRVRARASTVTGIIARDTGARTSSASAARAAAAGIRCRSAPRHGCRVGWRGAISVSAVPRAAAAGGARCRDARPRACPTRRGERRHGQRPRPRDLALPAPAPRQPRRLAAVGRRGAAPRPRARTGRCSSRSATRPATGATSWSASRFEDPAIAALMNEHFVCVKVDREERPDVDALYMEAVQAMTGHGGWPLNVFLTPEQVPFFGGTYFPPEPRHGMPSWRRCCGAVADAWDERARRDPRAGRRSGRAAGAAARVAAAVGGAAASGARSTTRCAALRASFDSVARRLGRRAEVPAARRCIEFLLAAAARDGAEARMALRRCARWPAAASTTRSAAASRATRSTRRWTVPHFEKMLYDNALLARAYLHGWQVRATPLLRRTAEETLDWVLREMRAPERRLLHRAGRRLRGRRGQVLRVDGRRAARGARRRTPTRRSPGSARPSAATSRARNVLEVARDPSRRPRSATRIRARLLEARAQRVRPGLDDKRLARGTR